MRATIIDSNALLISGIVVGIDKDVVSLLLIYGADKRRLLKVQGENDFSVGDKFIFLNDRLDTVQ